MLAYLKEGGEQDISPYLIKNAEDLKRLADLVNSGSSVLEFLAVKYLDDTGLDSDDFYVESGNLNDYINAGDYTITIKGKNRYKGETTVKITIAKAKITSIDTGIGDTTMNAYEAYEVKQAKDLDGIQTLANLPGEISITAENGHSFTVPVTWTTSSTYVATGADYVFTGALPTNNYEYPTGNTINVHVTITPVFVEKPTFADVEVPLNDNPNTTADDLVVEGVLLAEGSVSVEDEVTGIELENLKVDENERRISIG